MKITASAISLNVADEQASAQFAQDHLGFVEELANDGFVSLSRPDAGFNLIFLRTGLQTSKPDHLRGHAADGLLVVFVVAMGDRRPTLTSVIESRRSRRAHHWALRMD